MQRRFHNIATDEWSQATLGGAALAIDPAGQIRDIAASHPAWNRADIEAVDVEALPAGAVIVAQISPPTAPDPDQDTIDAVLDKAEADVTAADVKRALLADLRRRHRRAG